MSETWKDIVGYEGLYKISDLGRVLSVRFGPKNHPSQFSEPKLMKLTKSSTGYLHVQLYKNGKSSTKLIHTLVATAFVDNPQNKPEINHIDGNKLNNTPSNLEWVTKSENLKHAARTGLRVNPNLGKFGIANHVSKPVLQYDITGNFIKKWDCQSDAARYYGIRSSDISHCATGRVKMAHNFIWVYYRGGEIPPTVAPYVRRFRSSK